MQVALKQETHVKSRGKTVGKVVVLKQGRARLMLHHRQNYFGHQGRHLEFPHLVTALSSVSHVKSWAAFTVIAITHYFLGKTYW